MGAGELCGACDGAAAWGTAHKADDIQQKSTPMATRTRLLIKVLSRRDCLAQRQTETLQSNIYVYWP